MTACSNGSSSQIEAMEIAQLMAVESGACMRDTDFVVKYEDKDGTTTNPFTIAGFDPRIEMYNFQDFELQKLASLHEVMHFCHNLYYSETLPQPIKTFKGDIVQSFGFLFYFEDGTYDSILEEAYAYYNSNQTGEFWELSSTIHTTKYEIAELMDMIVKHCNNIDPSQMTLAQFIHAVFLKSMNESPNAVIRLADIFHYVDSGELTAEEAMNYFYILEQQVNLGNS